MLDAFYLFFAQPYLIGMLLLAVPIGLVFGIVPGLGGKIAIIATMPFLYKLDPMGGVVFLISLHAVVHTSGALPAILFGIPGTGPSTAIVADGHAMAKKGEANRALTASIVASAIGGVIGAIVLAMIIPFTLSLLKLFSYPEIFLLAIFGILFCALLSEGALIKGLITGCLGLFLSILGIEENFGVDRFTFELPFLWDGIGIVTAILSLYAIPEMIAASSKISQKKFSNVKMKHHKSQHIKGLKDIITHRWLVLRSSLIGTLIGIIPGLGGDVAAWFCYGHAAQSSKNPEKFGSGAIEGIIGPEAANNSKEGGGLVPTLFLGIPGSSGMAIFLIALVPLGISPGPDLAVQHPDLIWLMVWALAFSNIIASLLLYLLSFKLAQVAKINFVFLVPYIFIFAIMSVFLSTHQWEFFVVMAVISIVGYMFKKQGWPRAPFVIGFILGPIAEESIIKSVGIWGGTFFMRPMSLLIIGILAFGFWRISKMLMKQTENKRARFDD